MYRSLLHLFFIFSLVITVLGVAVPREADEIEVDSEVLEKRLQVSGTHSGDMTFYDVGLGACGWTDSDSELVAAVSHIMFDQFPGYKGGNPNKNPVCGKHAKITYKGKSVTVKIVDRCPGCATGDLDLSPSAFSKLANKDVGRLHGAKWTFQ
ncbi:RlpA-like double-psi beta-barrel-protein domain-containing protein-containing protein [Irpex rosettiformis]|uniref:RlpA-like double-psi beta-barrel-protein domain-containing protein-containing protein n=1 Tax=Irpex rosettiformis TaxID=378272 RepID=A0ACB8U8M5_9APHY|nr:RlpA-like double-psi beta-barrel-protein domain-containing protein-containing protein [Irpex rosettiformis]